MPMYDVQCVVGHVHEVLAPIADTATPCRTCGAPTSRVWLAHSAAVLGDEINEVLDNVGPEPVHVVSRTQRRALLKQRGLQEFVRHTDGDRHTSRWV